MSRPKSPLGVQRNEGLLQRIQELKAEQRFWGYRRIWAYLRVVEERAVNEGQRLPANRVGFHASLQYLGDSEGLHQR
jgi:hypothetical protein